MIKKGLALLLALICTLSLLITASAEEAESDVPVTEDVLVIKNLNTGINVNVAAASGKTYQATGVGAKLMTAMLAYDILKDSGAKISSPWCLKQDKELEATIFNDFSLGLNYSKTSSSLTVEDLVSAATISSAADACVSLAVAAMRYRAGEPTDYYNNYDAAVSAGAKEKAHINDFVALMNEKATELGCTNTVFVNCTGAPGGRTTAEDLVLIAEAFYNNTQLMALAGQASYSLSTGSNQLFNKSALMSSNDNLTGYTGLKGATGIIVGWMGNKGASPYCVVASGDTEDGLSYIFVCVSDQGETNATKTSAYDTVKNFLPWALDSFTYRLIVSPLNVLKTIPVKSGKDNDRVSIIPRDNIELLLPVTVNAAEDIDVEYVYYEEELTAPVAKGQKVGEVQVTYNGETMTTDLITNAAVSESAALSLLDKTKSFLNSDFMMKIYLCVIVLLGAYFIFSFVMFVYRIIRKYIAAGRGE